MSYPSITSRPTQGTGIAVSGSTVSLDQSFTDTRYVNTSGDTMTGVLSVVSGFAFSPGLRFDTDTDTGLYSAGSDILGVTVGGTLRLSISTTSVTSTLPCYVPGGNVTAPGYSFTNSPTSGLFALSSTLIALGVNSTSTVLFFPTMTSFVQPIVTSNGSASACSLAVGYNDTGLYSAGTSILGISAGGFSQLVISSSSATFTNKILAPDGAFATPSFAFANDSTVGFSYFGGGLAVSTAGTLRMLFGISSNGSFLPFSLTSAANSPTNCPLHIGSDLSTGLYRVAANNLGISAGGTLQLSISTTAATFTNQIIASTGTAAAPSYTFTGDTDTGLYYNGNANSVAFTAAGTQRFSFNTGGIFNFQSFFNIINSNSAGLNLQTATDGATVLTIYGHGVGYTDNVIRSQLSFGEQIDGVNGDRFHGKIEGMVINSGGDNNDYDSQLIFSVVENVPTVGFSSYKTMLSLSPAGINANSNKITSLATPTTSTDAATKGYVDSVASGLTVKDAVKVATTANITLSGTQTIDGVAVVASDRVLVKNQSTGSQNGIYIVAAGAWTRSTDADTSAEVTSGMYCLVTSGSTNGGEGWILTTANPITLGTTSLTFAQFSSSTSYIQGTGITISGNTVALDTSYTDTRYINTTGDTMSGTLSMGGNVITNVGTPSISTDAAPKSYVDTAVASKLSRSDLKLLPNNGDVDLTVSDTHDSGMITHTDGVVRSYTLGTGGSTGMTTTFVNNSATSVNLVQGSSTTVRETGTTNVGSRTLGAWGMATALKVNSNTWFVTGGVLT